MNPGIMTVVLCVTACGASYPAPNQRLADAQSAHRSAQEVGAEKQPAAQLHLRLAEEQIAKAKTNLENENNKRADFMLVRAKADAELALAMAHAEIGRVEAEQAVEQSNAQAATNARQGAGQ